jgi:mono/diheme cytochrome c family protein
LNTLNTTKLLCGIVFAASIAFSMPADSAADDGKITYNDSCIRCHGEAGIGNPVQDQFWKMKIPRLTASYVQKKSDSELKTIILNGKRKMPPVMLGAPETQHRSKVTETQVPGLIAYIRSLKKT